LSRSIGIGPFPRLILRNLTVIDGTGGPAYGPADIVVENNRIALVYLVGSPTGPRLQPAERPEAGPGGHEIDLRGHYVLPGLIDAHGHIGWPGHVPSAQYVYDLWLGHGITTVREPGCFINGLDFVRGEADRSARNEIAAPRISPYVGFGEGHPSPFVTPRDACAWVGSAAERGADGIKFFGYRADIYEAALKEATRLGLGSACHHHHGYVAQANALDSARWGLRSIEHFYGLPEAMLAGRRRRATRWTTTTRTRLCGSVTPAGCGRRPGGHVTVGTDPGSIFKLFGFGFPEEMELLREAGLAPLEVVRAATLWGAELLGWHAHSTEGIKNGLRAGVRSIEHGTYLDDECIEMMLANGTWLVPTLGVVGALLEGVANGVKMPEAVVTKLQMGREVHLAAGKRGDLTMVSGDPFDFAAYPGNVRAVFKRGVQVRSYPG
jgi:imidazolonepropionase-like amidohydrolase